MLVVVIVTALRSAPKKDAVMGVEDDEDEELTEKRDEYDDYDEMIEFNADVEKVQKGKKNSLTLRRKLGYNS